MTDYAAYLYTTDGGNIYQVLLPSDFAVGMFYQLASGNEPYLPASIATRFCTYISPTQNIWRQVVVTTPKIFSAPPASVVAGGVLYSLRSSIGEQVLAQQGANFLLAAGPQGPTGPQGPAGHSGVLSFVANMLVTGDIALAAGVQTLVQTTALAAGTWLICQQAIILCGASAGRVAFTFGGAAGGTTNLGSGNELNIAAAQEASMVLSTIQTCPTAFSAKSYATASVAMTIKEVGVTYALGFTNTYALQLA